MTDSNLDDLATTEVARLMQAITCESNDTKEVPWAFVEKRMSQFRRISVIKRREVSR